MPQFDVVMTDKDETPKLTLFFDPRRQNTLTRQGLVLPLRVRSLALAEINLKQSKSNDFIKIFSDQITKADVFRLDT